jgi:hypothetical protein
MVKHENGEKPYQVFRKTPIQDKFTFYGNYATFNLAKLGIMTQNKRYEGADGVGYIKWEQCDFEFEYWS